MALTYRDLVQKTAGVALLALLATAPIALASGAGGVGDLYITSDASNIVRAYNGASGIYIGDHVGAVLGSGQLGIHFGLTNGRMLVGSFGGGVDEYNATTGAYIKTYSPGGGWQWTGIYAPNGNVYIGSMNTNDVREYDVNTGAFVQVLCSVNSPADMRIGPNGNLYICSFWGGFVQEVNANNGAPINQWFQPFGDQTNDVAFLPGGDILVSVMGSNVVYRYNSLFTVVAILAGTGWQRPHGIDISPVDGNIYVVDGVTTQVHVFDSATNVEINTAFRMPDPGDKIVDLEFRRDNRITPTLPTTWTRLKTIRQ